MLDSVIGGPVRAKQMEKERSKSNRPMGTKQADDAGNGLILTELHVSRQGIWCNHWKLVPAGRTRGHAGAPCRRVPMSSPSVRRLEWHWPSRGRCRPCSPTVLV